MTIFNPRMMKRFIVYALLTLLSPIVNLSAHELSLTTFDSFFTIFLNSKEEQCQYVLFPLLYISHDESYSFRYHSIQKEAYSQIDFMIESPSVNNQQISENMMMVEVFTEDTDSCMKYFFSLIEGQWYLSHIFETHKTGL
ncbi:MAG: hypothetical protein ACI3Y4_01475 [Candidatus Cryptobacteroides sp.]